MNSTAKALAYQSPCVKMKKLFPKMMQQKFAHERFRGNSVCPSESGISSSGIVYKDRIITALHPFTAAADFMGMSWMSFRKTAGHQFPAMQSKHALLQGSFSRPFHDVHTECLPALAAHSVLSARLVMIGSCRGPADQERIDRLKHSVQELDLQVIRLASP